MTVETLLEGCEHDGSYIPVGEVKRLMKEYARFKCLEAIENTRYATVKILQDESYPSVVLDYDEADVEECIKKIQNIPNQDVMPEL